MLNKFVSFLLSFILSLVCAFVWLESLVWSVGLEALLSALMCAMATAGAIYSVLVMIKLRKDMLSLMSTYEYRIAVGKDKWKMLWKS